MIDDMEEIWALYADDGAQALDAAEVALSQIADGDASASQEGIASLFRAVHTFKGNARVLGLQVAESRAHLTEDLIGLVRDDGVPWDAEIEAILLLAVDRLRTILEHTAAQRSDVDEGVGSDLMDQLRDKIARIKAAPENGALLADLDAAPQVAATASHEDGASLPSDVQIVAAPDPDPVTDEQSLPPKKTDTEAPKPGPVTLLDGILASLEPLANADAQDLERRRDILVGIFDQADAAGYHRLADVAIQLSRLDRGEEVRLYEELHAIELSLGDVELPSPRPADLLSGWCADHAFDLIDQLRQEITVLSTETGRSSAVRNIEPLLRRLHFACLYFGLDKAAELAMSQLDLVMRTSIARDRDTIGADQTVTNMLETFVSTVELALDAAREGEVPDVAAIEALSAQSTHFDFSRRGGITASEALVRLNLPPQFLRVMSPRSVHIAQSAAAEGMRFVVVRTDFREDTDVAEKFFDMMSDGQVRQITSVSLLSEQTARFDFLLATVLGDAELARRLSEVDPTGHTVELLSADIAIQQAEGAAPRDITGVSVEMMEMLGEVSSGLASVVQNLRTASEAEARSLLTKAIGAKSNTTSDDAAEALSGFDSVMLCIEQALQTMDHLSRRVVALQEEAMSSRQRPADLVLRPLVDQIRRDSGAQAAGVQFEMSISRIMLDRQTLEAMEQVCDIYLRDRLATQTVATGKIEISLKKRDDRVLLAIKDDLTTALSDGMTEGLRAVIAPAGGRVWVQDTETGGQRLAVNLPTKMLAMEAMVAISGGVHYVLPVDALLMVVRGHPDCILRRAAAGASRYLKLDDGEVLPIVTLKGGNADAGGTFLIVQAEGRRKAVLVDGLLGQQVVRLRPLEGVLARLQRLAGLAVLAGGEVALALSPLSICLDEDIDAVAFAEV